jgi:hypothetical protein
MPATTARAFIAGRSPCFGTQSSQQRMWAMPESVSLGSTATKRGEHLYFVAIFNLESFAQDSQSNPTVIKATSRRFR